MLWKISREYGHASMVYQFHNIYIPVSLDWSVQPYTSLTEILQLPPMLMLLIEKQ